MASNKLKIGAHCVPCEGGIPPFTTSEAKTFLVYTPHWKLKNKRLERAFIFKDFKQSLAFVNRVGKIAEREGHHPDIVIHWNKVELSIWTHAISGLSENDFILARKIDQVPLK